MSNIIKENVISFEWSTEDQKIIVKYVNFLNHKRLVKLFKVFNPDEDSNIYIDKGINIPRTKLRNYIKDKNIRITSKLENANVVITTPDLIINSYTDYKYIYTVAVEDIIDNLYILGLTDSDFFNNYNYKNVIISWRGIQELMKVKDINYNSVKACKINDISIIKELLNKNLCYPDSLVSSIQKDGLIIDSDFYKQLVNMITSSDDDNLVLAMELMANSYYDKSAAYLLCLFYKYYNKFENHHKKNHVNFKGLLNYFNLSTSHCNAHFDFIIDQLIEKKQLTEESMDILKEVIIKNEWYAGINNNNQNRGLVVCKTISIESPEFIEAYGSPYVINI